MFDLFIVDYFGLFSFGFRLGISFKTWGSETAAELVLINIKFEGQFGHIRHCKLDLL